MSKMQPDDDPVHLRRRAIRLRDVARGVYDSKALEELERFIVELEARADELINREPTPALTDCTNAIVKAECT